MYRFFQPFYIQLAAITLYYYDYILTFGAEVSHVWPQPISLNTFLFFCNRYFAFSGNIVAAVLLFAPPNSSTSCSNLVRLRETLLVLGQIAVAAILATRTVALYNRSRVITIGVHGFGFLLIVVICWTLVVGERSSGTRYVRGIAGCRYTMPQETANHYALAWEASTLFDVSISALTIMRTLKVRKVHNMANSSVVGLLDVILRDGALYFFVMALANTANILSFYHIAGPFKAMYITPASCVASTLCSRLVLNLYDVAPQDGTTDSDSSPEPRTTGILTTRGISMDYDDSSEVKSSWV